MAIQQHWICPTCGTNNVAQGYCGGHKCNMDIHTVEQIMLRDFEREQAEADKANQKEKSQTSLFYFI